MLPTGGATAIKSLHFPLARKLSQYDPIVVNLRALILLLCFFVNPAFAHAVQAGPTQSNKSGELQGTVLESTSKNPIQRALVVLRKNQEPGLGTYTDAAGRFAFHGLDSGGYILSAEHEGFVAGRKSKSLPVAVEPGEPGEPIVLTLNRTGAISGHIVDPDDEPVAGASIQLLSLKTNKSRSAAVG